MESDADVEPESEEALEYVSSKGLPTGVPYESEAGSDELDEGEEVEPVGLE